MFYLKYRPQTIAQLDNKKIREALGQALLSNRWVHAYLLVGPKGTGKTTTARLIAKIVNCPNREKGEEPCNKCSSCRAITNGSSLDVIEIDAASNTGVEDIRDLREKAKLSPTGSRYKVYIIDEVHMLSTSAFNALLKILEEPPEHVIFVLATTDPQKLPATVVSRCLVYNFGETSKEDVIGKLQRISAEEKIKVDEEVLLRIVETVGTSHRDAQKLLEQVAMESANGKMADLTILTTQTADSYADKLLKELESKDSQKALGLVNEYSKSDGKSKDLIGSLVSNLRSILLFRNSVPGYDKSIKFTDEDIPELIEKLIAANAMLRDSPIPQLPLEMVIIEYCSEKPDKPENSENQNVRKSEESDNSDRSDSPKLRVSELSDFSETWPEILTAVKPHNHSLMAFLRASHPIGLKDDNLTLEVFYKFHKEKLEEKKNREILEKVVSDIMGRDLRVKFVLAAKK